MSEIMIYIVIYLMILMDLLKNGNGILVMEQMLLNKIQYIVMLRKEVILLLLQ